MTALAPGSRIGILGGGQLGRMMAIAAARLGYHVHVFAPEAEAVAGEVAASLTRADYANEAALAAFAADVDVITCEFENVPARALDTLARHRPVRPGPRAFDVAQDRLVEKRFVEALGGKVAPHAAVDCLSDLEDALQRLGVPAILKTRRMGYDGKGQSRIQSMDDAAAAFHALGGGNLLLEAQVAFTQEFSIILARGLDGAEVHYPPVENRHQAGILAESRAPAEALSAGHVAEATALAVSIADALDYVGVLACEFFAAQDGPVFNEMAPRVHNSGHWTIEGAITSQFEQHVRAIAGLPLGAADLVGGRVRMINILGNQVEDAQHFLAHPHAHLHLYGKRDAAPGRKMGHVTFVTG